MLALPTRPEVRVELPRSRQSRTEQRGALLQRSGADQGACRHGTRMGEPTAESEWRVIGGQPRCCIGESGTATCMWDGIGWKMQCWNWTTNVLSVPSRRCGVSWFRQRFPIPRPDAQGEMPDECTWESDHTHAHSLPLPCTRMCSMLHTLTDSHLFPSHHGVLPAEPRSRPVRCPSAHALIYAHDATSGLSTTQPTLKL